MKWYLHICPNITVFANTSNNNTTAMPEDGDAKVCTQVNIGGHLTDGHKLPANSLSLQFNKLFLLKIANRISPLSPHTAIGGVRGGGT